MLLHPARSPPGQRIHQYEHEQVGIQADRLPRGGHHGVDSDAFSLITPPNSGTGGGSCLPLMVVVALGVGCAALAVYVIWLRQAVSRRMVALLRAFPDVYVDVAGISVSVPRPAGW